MRIVENLQSLWMGYFQFVCYQIDHTGILHLQQRFINERVTFHLCSSFCGKIGIMPMNVFKHFVDDILFSLCMKSRVAWIEKMFYTISPLQLQKHVSGIDAHALCRIFYTKDSKFGRSLIFAHISIAHFVAKIQSLCDNSKFWTKKVKMSTCCCD